MFSEDLKIHKEITKQGYIYQLRYDDIQIKCFHSENFVQNHNKELIEFIKDDLFRCGELFLTKQNKLLFEKIDCAYVLFSAYESLLKSENYDGKSFEDFIKRYFIYDLLLINISSKNNKHLEKVRGLISKKIGSNFFEQLTTVAWGRWWNGNCKSFDNQLVEDKFCESDGIKETIIWEKNKIISRNVQSDNSLDYENPKTSHPMFSYDILNKETYKEQGVFISEDKFKKSKVAKTIFNHFEDCTEYEKTSILSLFHYSKRFSFLLPLSFIRGWINKKEFLNALLVLEGCHHSSESRLYSQEDHLYEYENKARFAVLCNDFAKIGTKIQREIWEKIQQGESEFIEFKQSLSLDIRNSLEKNYSIKKEKYIELSTLKTIAAFLNSKGGTLFIGVKDEPIEITSIDREVSLLFKNSLDEIQLHLKNLIKNNFGTNAYPLIHFEVKKVFKQNIIVVDCKSTKDPVFIKEGQEERFYVRKGPSTDKLSPKKMLKYITERDRN